MRFQFVLLGVFSCLTAQAVDKSNRGAPMPKPSALVAPQPLTGCVDEQDGQYVLLDNQLQKIANLRFAGPDQEVFAKHLGHTVQVRGTKPSEQKGAFTVTSIKQVSEICGQEK